MRQVDKDGVSVRQKLESVYRQTGRKPAELEAMVDLPESMRQVWFWFNDLSNSRQDSFGGECVLTYAEMLAYFTLLGIEPEDWEVSLIKQLDIIYINNQRSKQRAQQTKSKSKK